MRCWENCLSYSRAPLRLMIFLGFFVSMLSFVVGLAYLAAKLIFWYSLPIGVAPGADFNILSGLYTAVRVGGGRGIYWTASKLFEAISSGDRKGENKFRLTRTNVLRRLKKIASWGSPTRLSRASLRRPIVSPGFRKAALTANFAHDDAPAQSLATPTIPRDPIAASARFCHDHAMTQGPYPVEIFTTSQMARADGSDRPRRAEHGADGERRRGDRARDQANPAADQRPAGFGALRAGQQRRRRLCRGAAAAQPALKVRVASLVPRDRLRGDALAAATGWDGAVTPRRRALSTARSGARRAVWRGPRARPRPAGGADDRAAE